MLRTSSRIYYYFYRSYKDASVAAQNDCFGAQFGVLRQPLRPAAAAAAIDEKRRCNRIFFLILVYCGFFYCGYHLRIWLESIAAPQKKRLLRRRNRNGSSSIAALLYCGALGAIEDEAPQLERFYTVPYFYFHKNFDFNDFRVILPLFYSDVKSCNFF